MTLPKLRSRAAAIQFGSGAVYDREAHRSLYTYWDERFEPRNAKIVKEEWPSFDLIVYALRSKLYPTVIQIQIPDILRLLAWVEQYRSSAWKKATVAIELNKGFRKQEPALALKTEQRRLLKDLTRDSCDERLRELYLAILSDFCKLEIYSLWAAENFPLLPIRLAENFPGLHSAFHQDGLRPPTPEYPVFYDDFTDEEKQTHTAAGAQCIAVIEQTVSGSITPEELLDEFEQEEQVELLEDVELFVTEVTKLVEALEKIFPMENDS